VPRERHGPCVRSAYEKHFFPHPPTRDRGHILRSNQHQFGWRERIADSSWDELGVTSNERFRLDRITVRLRGDLVIAGRDVISWRDILAECDLLGWRDRVARSELRSRSGRGRL